MSLSNPTIRYETSSTELFSFFEDGMNGGGDGVGSVSVRLIRVLRLLPPDVLFGDDVTVMMSSTHSVLGNSGTGDVLTGASVDL